jgi:hypothetical protein
MRCHIDSFRQFVGAAHCAGAFTRGAWLGANLLTGEDKLEKINTEFEYPHPRYSSWTIENDVMIIKLAEPSNLTAIQLNFDHDNPVDGGGETFTNIGSGRIEENGDFSDILMKLQVIEIDHETCTKL